MVASPDPISDMGGVRTTHDHRPPDPAAARARRTLAASRAARAGISNMVDALRISRPPRGPGKGSTNANGTTGTTARRHALIPLAEGRDQLESRIRTLEDVVTSREEALVRLKRQLGRTLIKRRHVERERDSAMNRLSQAVAEARAFHNAAASARSDLKTTIEDVSELLRISPDNEADASILIDDISAALDIATAKLSIALPPCTVEEQQSSQTQPLTRPRTTPSVVLSDEDARSCASFASSALGDDRDAQLESLIELVDILDAKLASGPPHQDATNAVTRARRTVESVRAEKGRETNGKIGTTDPLNKGDDERRKEISRIVSDLLSEKCTNGSFNLTDDVAQVAIARAELREVRESTERLRVHNHSLERALERATQQTNLIEQNENLQRELANARRTITRMIQERGPQRRFAARSAAVTPASATREPRGLSTDPEAIRRVLNWRYEASTASRHGSADDRKGTSTSDRAADANDGVNYKGENKTTKEMNQNTGGNFDEERYENGDLANSSDNDGRSGDNSESSGSNTSNPKHISSDSGDNGVCNGHDTLSVDWNSRLPDRNDGPMHGPSSRSVRRSRDVLSNDGVKHIGSKSNVESGGSMDEATVSDKSLDVDPSDDNASIQSLPARTSHRRHESFLSASGLSIAEDEVTIVNRRNIFNFRQRHVEGLRGLLGS